MTYFYLTDGSAIHASKEEESFFYQKGSPEKILLEPLDAKAFDYHSIGIPPISRHNSKNTMLMLYSSPTGNIGNYDRQEKIR